MKDVVKKVLGNRFARLVLGLLLTVVLAAVGVVWTNARRERERLGGGTAAAGVAAPTPRAPEIEPGEAGVMLKRGEALILDVRDASAYEALGHMAGAVNIPLRELHSRAAELPKDKLIITYAYARVPDQVEAARLAAAMLWGERRAAVLKGDYDDWHKAGLSAEPRGALQKVKRRD